MSAPEHACSLLAMARKDFDAVRGMIDNPLFADEIFGFHAQQAIEKSLKAWLTICGVDYPHTHDLSRLLSLLETQGIDMDRYWPVVELTLFAVQARYDADLLDSEAPLDRLDIIDQVEQVLAAVVAVLVAATPDNTDTLGKGADSNPIAGIARGN